MRDLQRLLSKLVGGTYDAVHTNSNCKQKSYTNPVNLENVAAKVYSRKSEYEVEVEGKGNYGLQEVAI